MVQPVSGPRVTEDRMILRRRAPAVVLAVVLVPLVAVLVSLTQEHRC